MEKIAEIDHETAVPCEHVFDERKAYVIGYIYEWCKKCGYMLKTDTDPDRLKRIANENLR